MVSIIAELKERLIEALKAALEVAEAVPEMEWTAEDVRALGTTIFLGLDRRLNGNGHTTGGKYYKRRENGTGRRETYGPVCPTHKKARRGKDGSFYCPTRLEDGSWCGWKGGKPQAEAPVEVPGVDDVLDEMDESPELRKASAADIKTLHGVFSDIITAKRGLPAPSEAVHKALHIYATKVFPGLTSLSELTAGQAKRLKDILTRQKQALSADQTG